MSYLNIDAMKLRNLLLLGLASAALLAGCKKDELEDPGTPSISINPTTLPAFPVAGGADNAQTASLTSTRDWTATADADWVVVSPASGSASAEAQEITVYADGQNDGVTRTATITFATSTVSTTLSVSQTGAAGSIEDTYVYHNDFDKEAATQTYGTDGNRWPYLDQFEGWHNETGSGIEAVDYDYASMSARNNTQSDGNYSDYEGSGVNNLMFGSSAYFQVNNIAVREGSLNYTLSFGTERYVYDAEDNTFNPEEFHVYVSDNGERWVELSYTFPDGFKNGRWDLASTTFTVPEGTTALYLYFSSDLGSAHRLDDLTLAVSTEAGTEIDFSQGGAIGGGDDPAPVPDDAVYFNDFDKEAAQNSNGWPYADSFDGCRNDQGTGASTVTFSGYNTSVRTSGSSDQHSDYDGSGMNNIFFGQDNAYFRVNNITLDGTTANYTLSFGSEKYLQNQDSMFSPDEFKVYLSNDGTKWVEIEYAFPEGFKDGTWDLASSTFTLPSGTTSLYIHFTASVASAYRIDDLSLVPSETAGTSIDFSQGIELGGDEPQEPGEEMTIDEVVAAADDTPVTVKAQVMAKSTNGFIISDETGSIFVFGGYADAPVVSEVEIGDNVTISGTRDTYNQQAQIGSPTVSDITSGTAVYPDDPMDLNGNENTVISGPIRYVTWTGEITSKSSNGNYYNFVIEGATRGGSIYFADPELNFDSMIGKQVVVTGYYMGHSDSYLYVLPVSVTLSDEPEEPGDEMTIAQVVVAADDTPVAVKGQVMAKSTNGFVISDETGNIFVYGGTNTPIVDQVEIGSYATVSGTKGTYNNQAQIASPSVSDVTPGEAVYPGPVELNGNENAITSGLITYVTWTGVITKSGNYYNFDIAGASRTGSVYYADPSLNIDSVVGQQVVMTGYYVSHSSSFLYVLPVSVTASDEPYLNISDETKSVSSAAGSFTFDITSNTDWTVSSSDGTNFSVAPASGSDNGTVTVNYTENTSSDSRAATITVRYGSESKALTVTQSGASAPGEEVTDVLTADLFPATNQNYTDFSGVTVTSPAVYAGQTAAQYEGVIQMRSKNDNSGIVTTTSGGKVRKIVVTWNSHTTSPSRYVDIYVSNEAYTSATELYGSPKGTMIGSIQNGQTTFEITGDYEYVGLRSRDGAIYIDQIDVVWE